MLGFMGGLTSKAATGLGTAFNFLRTGLGFLRTAFQFVFAQLMGFGGLLLRIGALLGGIVIGGLVSFVAAIGAATKASMEYSRSVINLRNSTGMTTGAARSMTGRFGAFGIKPDELGNNGQFHGLTQMIGKMFRADVTDPASINARSQSFGSGMMGHAMRKSFLGAIGMDTDSGRFLANLPSEKVRGQLDFQSGITAKMGVSPEIIRQLAEDLPLLTQRFTIFKDLLITKVASVALPYVMRGFEKLSDFLSARGGQIGELIGRAVEWTMNALVKLSEFLIANGPVIGETLIGWAKAFLIGAGNMLKGFGEWTAGIIEQVPAILGVLDSIFNGFRLFIAAVWGAAQVIIQAGRSFGFSAAPAATTTTPTSENLPKPPSVIDALTSKNFRDKLEDLSSPLGAGGLLHPKQGNFLPTLISAFLRLLPIVAAQWGAAGKGAWSAIKAVAKASPLAIGVGAGYMGYNALQNAKGTFGQAQSDALARFPVSNLAGNSEFVNRIQGFVKSVSDGVLARSNNIFDAVDSLDSVLQELRTGNKIASQNEKNTRDIASQFSGFSNRLAQGTVDRVLSYISEDTFLGLVGS